MAEAAKSGRRVEVLGKRTTYTQLFAEPSGRLTYEAAAVPQRTRRPDGSWADIDLTLRAGRDGRWRPAASIADVTFSSGGSGPFVTMVDSGKALTMTWPGGSLPPPVVAGDSATYPDVLPSVDLVVRATRTGFTHVLVVKTPAAAAAVREVRFDIGGDVVVARTPDGGLSATAGTDLVATAAPATMWDSTSPAASSSSFGATSTHAIPGGRARVAPVATEVTTRGDLVLRPDRKLLAAEPAAFPLYIDPPWSTGKSRWAYATNNNSNNTDTSVARVGRDPESGTIYRSYFEFPLSPIKGKHVASAYVQMKLDHSWSCDNTWTHMYHTKAIATTPRTKWAPGFVKWLAAAESHANEGDGCDDSPQADMTVNFINGNVTSLIQQHATNNWTTVTVGFCACNANGEYESATDRWKKFFPANAKLITDVDAKPGKPSSLQVNGVACTSTGISIGTLTPTLSAVFPDADSGQAIRGTWEWLEVPATGTWTDATPRKTAPAQTSVPAGSRATTSALSGAAADKKYAFRAKGTDPAPYNQTGNWSDWCVFETDNRVSPVTVREIALPPEPGKTGTFELKSDPDVVKFRYGWTDAVTSEVTPTLSGGFKTATITVTAPKYGENVLYVQAIDDTNNKSFGSHTFPVGRPSPAVARWGLETYPGVGVSQALDDQQPALADDTPLTGSALSWVNDARLVGGQTVRFNGGGSQAVATNLIPNTTSSFSVAAWVRLQHTTGSQTVISKDGAAGEWSVFRLQMRNDASGVPRWCFLMATSVTTAAIQAVCSSTTAMAGRWTHIAAAYDRAEGKMRVWVDGASAEAAFTTPLTTTGPLVVGRGVNAGAPADRLYADVADVQFFNRVLVDHDFTGQTADAPNSGGVDEPGILEPILAGDWNFNTSASCYDEPTVFNNCLALPADNWNRRVRFGRGMERDDGRREGGVLLDHAHWAESPDPYAGTWTDEYGYAQRNAAPSGQPEQWQNTAVLRTDQSYTVSVWLKPDKVTGGNMTALSQQGSVTSRFFLGLRNSTVDGVTAQRWALMSTSTDAADSFNRYAIMPRALTEDDTTLWTHVVAVYDAGRQQIRLYVNGDLEGQYTEPTGWQANGPLTVGGALWSPVGGTPRMVDGWLGGIDDLRVYQGAMTDARVQLLHDEQALPGTE